MESEYPSHIGLIYRKFCFKTPFSLTFTGVKAELPSILYLSSLPVGNDEHLPQPLKALLLPSQYYGCYPPGSFDLTGHFFNFPAQVFEQIIPIFT